jgi:hypothetical protein
MSADEPTIDKPDVELVPYEASSRVSTFMHPRVADIEGSAEIRSYMRDADGYLIEGRLARAGSGGQRDRTRR